VAAAGAGLAGHKRVAESWRTWTAQRAQRNALTALVTNGLIPDGVEHDDGRLVRRRDSAKMALVPAGEFLMGGTDEDEGPTRPLRLAAFLMDRFEVTNRQFKQFVDDVSEWAPGKADNHAYLTHWRNGTYPAGEEMHPVHHVPWDAAQAYARWAGATLPTEAQWEKAARGGLKSKRYPWGDEQDPAMANWGRPRWPHLRPGRPNNMDDFVGARFELVGTTPVGSFPANAYGLHDMAGNVWEWCTGWYAPQPFMFAPDGVIRAPCKGVRWWGGAFAARCARGGSWYRRPDLCRCANRSYDHFAIPIITFTDYYYGFRCVVPLGQ